MLPNHLKANPDIVESIVANGNLVEQVFAELDKLQALCSARKLVDSGEELMPKGVAGPYSELICDRADNLRVLLTKIFDGQ
ncbi:hypothetical protein NBRC116495_07160 [Aurantivibrio plasticivorans]